METTTLALLRQSVAMAFFCLTGFSCFGASEAEEKLHFSQFVRPYEPIKIGFTKDEGDQLYMDFSLSVMLPAAALIPHPKIKPENYFPREGNVRSLTGERFPNWYIAFNGRAGQYVGTRKSSPVVGKRFNPLLAARWWRGGSVDFGLHDYFEVSYGHESNGQRLGDLSLSDEDIDWAARFEALKDDYRGIDDNPTNIARDEISRGWDYVGARWSRAWRSSEKGSNNYFLVDAKYFLSDGFLQGDREDYYEWENDLEWLNEYNGKIQRSKVDGLTISYRRERSDTYIPEFGIELKTGYRDPFERVTIKLEVGVLRYTLWYRYGYNSDFVNYYHKDESFGVAFKVRQF